ncbi:MAG: 3-dehydroquinate synthase [Gammaproteobacteria bacterium]|nr:3-dehydroquinate synthase [Gammaproteobacteria bacterium]
MATLTVDLGSRSYPIIVGSGLLAEPSTVSAYIPSDDVLVVTNETVAPLYLDRVMGLLGNRRVISQTLPDGEQYKSFETLQRVFDTLLQSRFSRDATLVALGGGVIGDLVGFAAACYQRGVSFVQIPTTLLAQVDSAVGGKTAVNHPAGKNMIGAFHQPACVIADTDTLRTLESRELAAGIAEVIKYGLIRDRLFFEWLESNMDHLLNCDQEALQYVIMESCRHKAEIVANDEKEAGERAILNLGHTFGHAIETASGYGSWLHGEAVAVGMLMAVTMSEKLGWLDRQIVDRTRRLLLSVNLPVAPPQGMTADDFLKHMSVDKKVVGGKIRLVLLHGLGCAKLVEDYPEEVLLQVLNEFSTI